MRKGVVYSMFNITIAISRRRGLRLVRAVVAWRLLS